MGNFIKNQFYLVKVNIIFIIIFIIYNYRETCYNLCNERGEYYALYKEAMNL